MKRGVSLMEIIVAGAILVASMVPLWGLMSTSHKQVTFSAEELKASALACEIFEQLENKGWVPSKDTVYQLTPVSENVFKLENLKLTVSSYTADLKDLKITAEAMPSAAAKQGEDGGKVVVVRLEYSQKMSSADNARKSYSLAAYLRRK